MPFQVPLRCTLITWSNWSSVIVRMVASRVMPALLTMMSSDPNVSTVCASMASISAALVTSQRATAATSGPPSLAAATCVASRSRSPSTTRAPCLTNTSAMAKPMPCAPPVMTAVRPSRIATSASFLSVLPRRR